MGLLLIISCLAVLQAVATQRCSGTYINGVFHIDEIINSDIDRPHSLSYDYTNYTVYFSDYAHVSKIDLYTKELTQIDGPRGGASVSVDPYTSDVYIGGDSGVYKYNKITNKSEIFGANGTNVGMVFSNGIVYFTDAATNFLYTIVDGAVTRLEDLKHTTVTQFVIDNDDLMFFSNSSGLFRQKKGTNDAVHYIGTDYRRITCLSVDTNGYVYVVYSSIIWFVNKQGQNIRAIARIGHCNGLAFDDLDNIIYSDTSSIHRIRQPSDVEFMYSADISACFFTLLSVIHAVTNKQ